MQTLVKNLVCNAVEAAIGESQKPRISISLTSDTSVAVLTVEDCGPGISNDTIRRHLFDPFFSGRQAGRGIGFGLPVCWQIVRSHAGIILMEETTDGCTRFVVLLPRSR